MKVTDLLSGSVISSIAKSTGTTKNETQSVLANALPTLVKSMAKNASTESGAASLSKALANHTTTESLTGLLKNVDTADGGKILNKILGSSASKVESDVAKKSGVTKAKANNILATAAPLLLSALSSQQQATNTPASGLSGLLTSLLGSSSGSSKPDTAGTLLSLAGSLLSSNTSSSNTSSASHASSSASSNPSNGKKIVDILGKLLSGK